VRFLDTNVIIRLLTRDDQVKAEASLELFKRIGQGVEEVQICESMVAEIAYVLSSRALYNLDHSEIRDRLAPLLGLRGLRVPNKTIVLRALDLYAEHSVLDFEDALAVSYMEAQRIEEIYSYDHDFDRVQSITRVEP